MRGGERGGGEGEPGRAQGDSGGGGEVLEGASSISTTSVGRMGRSTPIIGFGIIEEGMEATRVASDEKSHMTPPKGVAEGAGSTRSSGKNRSSGKKRHVVPSIVYAILCSARDKRDDVITRVTTDGHRKKHLSYQMCANIVTKHTLKYPPTKWYKQTSAQYTQKTGY